jgi:AcrR family transcriptional regulator
LWYFVAFRHKVPQFTSKNLFLPSRFGRGRGWVSSPPLTFIVPIGIINVMDNRTVILDAALTLFAAKGYDGVGVQEIVEAAGLTKPTLYHYFGSKQGLLQALIELHHAPLEREIFAAAVYHGDLPATLETLARAFFNCARRDPVYYRMQLSFFLAAPDSEAYRQIAPRGAAQRGAVEALFAAAVKDHGNMRGRHTLYAAAFIGSLNTCAGLWLNGALDLDDELPRRLVRQFQYGIYS